MFLYFFTFRGLTAAQSARSVLHDAGIWTRLQRAPAEISGLGCAYAVHVQAQEAARAAQLLRVWQKQPSGIYRLYANGFIEEAAL